MFYVYVQAVTSKRMVYHGVYETIEEAHAVICELAAKGRFAKFSTECLGREC